MGAGSTKPGEPGQRAVQAFDLSRSSSDEPTESSVGFDSPPPQRRSPTRRKPATAGGSHGAAAAGRRGAAGSSRRSGAAARGGPSSSSPGVDTRAASAADLNNQLDELNATFTSLGIVGRQLGGEGSSASSPSSLQSSQTSCQLQQQLEGQQQPLQQSSGSSGSRCSRERRRTQPFSWEERSASQQDNWNYQKVSLDGFDAEKFKKANKGASYDADIRITGDYGARGGKIAVPEYDHQDQQILASIERDFDKLIPL